MSTMKKMMNNTKSTTVMKVTRNYKTKTAAQNHRKYLLAESLAVMTVEDIYADWNLKAEQSKSPEQDVLIITNHPALRHQMEVKPKGLHRQVFNFISYYELFPKIYNEADRNKLMHTVQNIPNTEMIRTQLGMLLKIIGIYGNLGSVSAELDKDTPYRGYENAQNQITSYYIANQTKIIPDVIKTQIPPRGKVTELPSELQQVFASQHHFLCTKAMPIPAITECKYSRFKIAHDMMRQL
jgi:hypothetical protein